MPGHIPFATVDAWLRAHRTIWLATTQPDGRPHVAPVWFLWDGRALYFNTGRATQKWRNLSQQPAAVAHLGDGDDVVVLEGRVAVATDPAELARVDRAFRGKYVDPHSGATAGFPENAGDLPLRLDVARIIVWLYGVVQTRTDFLPGAGGWRPVAPKRL